jgi:hypothetical protein
MTTATMTITRTIQVATFYDAAGVPTTEPEDIDIEVEITGDYQPAEPDVGIMRGGYTGICATDEDGNEVELTAHEEEIANERLNEAAQGEYDDAREAAAEARADARRYWRELEDRS